ncbi:MAG: hypothetical protein ONB48_17670 [candidate division KSB1 bacterium]|nr:hypothetical protein [candidate division KSB1 bacterium]MDZ7275305.1 hypothetical protein [candidate division KSB1 bacterium]MDZ7287473.1 hypothetical protein [candidate division KSB1 bacterium]MDZ7299587.1 hypothetical protein [candidate division KSB1 bacterium]MDZ7307475.1 hypothetical protein [candidate division KSB1 bacterium]
MRKLHQRSVVLSQALQRCFVFSCAFAVLAGELAQAQSIQLRPLSTKTTGVFNQSASEISAYDEDSRRLFVVNARAGRLDVLDISNPAAPVELAPIELSSYGPVVNSVAVDDGLVAVAVENAVKTAPGKVVFFDVAGTFLGEVTVGALPDMLTFTPNGKWLLVANEGEPSDDYSVDPEGSISIIEVSRRGKCITQAGVRTADFTAFNDKQLDASIRIFGPHASVAQDLEPE